MRPPALSCLAIRSIALAICGSAFRTARGTLWSSRLISRAMAIGAMVSSEAAERLRRSVPSLWMSDLLAIDGFDHGIVKTRPQFFDRLVLAVRSGAIGQQRNREFALGIDPERCAGVTKVTVRSGIKILSGLRRLRGRVPAQSARCPCRRFLPPRKKLNRLRFEQRRATTQQTMRKLGQVAGGREHSRVAGDAAHNEGVLIVDLALDHAIANLLTIRCRHDLSLQLLFRLETGRVHLQALEYVESAKTVERRTGELLQCLSQQNESDVTVFGARSGVGGERDLRCCL